MTNMISNDYRLSRLCRLKALYFRFSKEIDVYRHAIVVILTRFYLELPTNPRLSTTKRLLHHKQCLLPGIFDLKPEHTTSLGVAVQV